MGFLAAQSSSRSLVVCPPVRLSVCLTADVCEKVTSAVSKDNNTYLPTYLWDSSDSYDNIDSSDSTKRSDGSDSSDQKNSFR